MSVIRFNHPAAATSLPILIPINFSAMAVSLVLHPCLRISFLEIVYNACAFALGGRVVRLPRVETNNHCVSNGAVGKFVLIHYRLIR